MTFDVLLAALLVFIATTIGSIFLFLVKSDDKRKNVFYLAFAAGVMFFSVFELFINAIDKTIDVTLLIYFFAGVTAVALGEHLIPHVHYFIRKKSITPSKKKTALVIGAIAIHNFPEGFAIASAFLHSASLGWLITFAIALQDIPEGFMVSAPAYVYGIRKKVAIYLGSLSGFLEAISVIFSYYLLSSFSSINNIALAFSAGAMTNVVLLEVLPDAFSEQKYRTGAVISFFIGLALVFALSLFFS
ncbi:MAG: ZIP family metal transporter [Candidatus Bilamarchaeaceae archaeon]